MSKFNPQPKPVRIKVKKVYVLKRTPLKKKKYVIPKRSKKREAEDVVYRRESKKFLALPENKKCFIEGCDNKATTIEHSAGRGINYLNISTWRPCCAFHNPELENNPKLSRKYQVSKIHGGKKIDKTKILTYKKNRKK